MIIHNSNQIIIFAQSHIRSSIFETLINFHAPTFMILAVLKNATQMFPAQRLWRFIYGETQLRQRCPIRVSSRILRIVASEKNHRYRTPRLSACRCMHGNAVHKVNSVQEAFAKSFAVHISKFENLQITWKRTKNMRLLVFSFSPMDLVFWCFIFCLFKWLAQFQILIGEPQSIWQKLLVLSWL